MVNPFQAAHYELTFAGLPNLVTAVAIVVFGVAVAIREGFSPLSRRFLVLNAVAAVWLGCFAMMVWSVEEPVAFIWAKLAYLGIPFIPVALYTFTLTLFGKVERRAVQIASAWLTAAVFSVLFIATDWFCDGLYLYPWGYYTRLTDASLVFFLFFFVLLAASVRHYVEAVRNQPSSLDRKRSRILLWAIALGHLGLIDFLPSLEVNIFPMGFVGLAGYLVLVWYAITRYRLVELTPAFAAGEILATMHGAVVVLDLEEHVQFVNRAGSELLGYGSKQMVGLPIRDVVGSEWTNPGASALERWTFRERAMTWVARDGRKIPVNVSAAMVRDWDRRPAGIILTAVDVTEREIAERKLREGERRYRELVEKSPDLIAISREGRIVFVNPAGVSMVGARGAEDLIGRNLSEFVHQGTRAEFVENAARLLAGRSLERAEHRLLRLDGGIVDAELIGLAYTWEGQAALLLIARNVTDRRRAHDALKHSLSVLQSTLESTADGILVVDRLGKVVSFNRRFLDMWGIPDEISTGAEDDALLRFAVRHVVDPEAFLASVRELYREPNAERYDVVELIDGRIIERFSTPQRLEGMPVGRVWSFRDVTDQKRSERALRTRDRILEAVAFASEGFLRAPDWRADIEAVLGRFGEATGVSSVRILETVAGSGGLFVLRHAWSAKGVVESPVSREVDLSRFWHRLERREIIYEPVEIRPGERVETIIVPIVVEQGIWGAIEWRTPAGAQRRSPDELEVLRTAAGSLAAAIARERTVEALEASERRYRLLFERNLAGVYRNSLDGRVLDCNDACARIFGYASREELIGRDATDVYFDPRDRERLVRDLQERRTLTNREVCFRRRDGSPVWVLENVSLLEDESTESTVMEGTIIDINDRKEAERQIEYQAYHDALTDLPNRMLFLDRLSVAIAHAHRFSRYVAVMFLDLDHFKFINDTLGHTVGDLLLRAVARRLGDSLRGEDTVARIGGDEFTILLSNLPTQEDVPKVAQKVLESIAKPIRVEGHELFVTTSIGIALYPEDGRDAETLLKNADIAMYRAKEQGRNTFQLCTPAMNARALERLTLENQLRRAVDRAELMVHYQPQFRITTGSVGTVEALVRWRHPERGLILPGEFIGVAEESRLILPIGEFVLREACRQIRRIRAAGYPGLRVAVNLSARQFQQHDLVRQLRNVLEETGVEPHGLEVEITEGVAMQNTDWTIGALHELKDLGVGIVLDDFGTGHSSLNYLRRFPIDGLKIDQSFVRELGRQPSDRAIVTAIITMAKGLNLRVVAEGVETEEQRKFLIDHGCDELQGFLFSPAVDAVELIPLLAAKVREDGLDDDPMDDRLPS